MNPFLRAEFCTSMGKIMTRGKTGLQRGSQRKMGKAVRRARVSGPCIDCRGGRPARLSVIYSTVDGYRGGVWQELAG